MYEMHLALFLKAGCDRVSEEADNDDVNEAATEGVERLLLTEEQWEA
jgi:hypothetical protein